MPRPYFCGLIQAYRRRRASAGEPLAYALQVVAPGVPCALIDYFAVRADLRGGGVGTRALHTLRRHYAGRLSALLTECEPPAVPVSSSGS